MEDVEEKVVYPGGQCDLLLQAARGQTTSRHDSAGESCRAQEGSGRFHPRLSIYNFSKYFVLNDYLKLHLHLYLHLYLHLHPHLYIYIHV